MSNQLLPCPFCGGDANAKPHSQHLPGCYFDAMAALKAAPKGDLSMAPEVVRAWNRRATQPAAGESVSEFFVDFDTLRKALSIYGLAAPVSNEELGFQMERQAIRVIKAVAKLPFPYPPAAAHGDEYEIWSAAQLAPGEGIEDGAERIRVLIGNGAHGDEAVRKDAERYQALRNTPEIFIGVAEGEDMVFLKSPEQLDQLADNAAAMRAQAGEGGEV